MANYRGKGGKRGPGSKVTGKKGGAGLGTTPKNTFSTQLARRYAGMRGKGVVRDPKPGGSSGGFTPRGHGGKRGVKSSRITPKSSMQGSNVKLGKTSY